MIRYKMFFILILGIMAIEMDAQVELLVKDITPGVTSTFSSEFDREDGIILSFQDKILFKTKDDAGQFSLWVSGGDEQSTFVLHELENDDEFSQFLANSVSHVYYSVSSAAGDHVFSLDKSTLDTSRIYSDNDEIRFLTYLNDQLYFALEEGSFGGDYLMRLNPLTEEVEMVYGFNWFKGIRDIGVFGDHLILIAEGTNNSLDLYVSDGTSAGTESYYVINDGSDSSGDYFMTTVDDLLFFFHNKPSEPYTLYVTDGTTSGTLPLMGLERLWPLDIEKTRSIVGWNGKLFFKGRETDNGGGQDDFFVSDGTVNGTFKININDKWAKPEYFTPYKGELYFKADYLGFIFTVYKTDGTQAGTVEAIDSDPLGGGLSFGGDYMTVYDDSLFFNACRTELGCELWASAGNTGSTRLIELVPGSDGGNPIDMTATERHLFFIYNSPDYGNELFVLNRTIVSTKNVQVTPISISPNPFSGQFQINLPKASFGDQYLLKVVDVLGRTVYFDKNYSAEPLKLDHVKPGTYYLQLSDEERTYSAKIIKVDH